MPTDQRLESPLTRFTDNAGRMVYAAWRDDLSRPFFLPDGQATRYRALTREHLRCPIPDCADPTFTTVSRRGARDGFRHLPGHSGHPNESVNHAQAKLAIATWAKSLTNAHVTLEAPVHDGARRPDVLLTSTRTGRRLAVEIQYSPMTIEQWTAREADYHQAGIQCVWMLGHTGPHTRMISPRDTDFTCARAGWCHAHMAWTPLVSALVDSSQRFYWINPITSLIGVPWSWRFTPQADIPSAPRRNGRDLHMALIDLNDLRLTASGIGSAFADRFLATDVDQLHR